MGDIFDDVLTGLEKTGSIGREVLLRAVAPERKLKPFDEILSGEKRTSPEEVIEVLSRKSGLSEDIIGGLAGAGAGALLGGPIGAAVGAVAGGLTDFGRSFGVDVLTSPDSLVFGQAAKLGGRAGKAISSAKSAEKLGQAAGVGSAFGALSASKDDDIFDVAKKVAAGAALGPAVRLAPKAIKATVGAVDREVSRAIQGEFPEVWQNMLKRLGQDDELLTAGQALTKSLANARRLNPIVRRFVLGDRKVSEFLKTDAEKAHFNNIIEEGLNDTVRTRENLLELDFKARTKDMSDADRALRAQFGIDLRKPSSDKFQELTEKANTHVGRSLDRKLSSLPLDEEGIKNVRLAVNAHRRFNKEMIKSYNLSRNEKALITLQKNLTDEEVASIRDVIENGTQADISALKKKFEGIEGIDQIEKMRGFDFHTSVDREKSLIPEEGGNLQQFTEGFKQRRTGLNTGDVIDLTEDEARLRRAQRFANAFSTKSEQQARVLLADLSTNIQNASLEALGGNVRGSAKRKLLNFYDSTLNLVKAQHLVLSHTWIMNQFPDNLMRAFVVNGGGSAGRALRELLPFNKRGSIAKIMKATDPSNNLAKIDYNDNILNAMGDLNLIDADRFTEASEMITNNRTLFTAKKGEARVKELEDMFEKAKGTKLGRGKFAMDKMSNWLWNSTAARYGGAVETSVKSTVFEDLFREFAGEKVFKRAMKEEGFLTDALASVSAGTKGTDLAAAKLAANKAADIVRDTFFDYKNISLGERAVMRRIFPYWVFASRNFEFFADAFFDPKKLPRLTKAAARPILAAGDPLSDREKQGLPDFFSNQGFRVASRQGRDVTLRGIPSLSFTDFATSVSNPQGILNKISPILKTAAEQVLDYDFFLEEPLTPSKTPSGLKRIFREGAPFNQIGKAVGLDMGLILEDPKGRLYTDSWMVSRLANLGKSLTPVPVVQTVAGTIQDISSGKKTVAQALESLGPSTVTTFSKKQIRKRAKSERRKARKLENPERLILQRARRK